MTPQLALRQRPRRHDVHAPGECLRGEGQTLVARGPGEDEATGARIAVQLSLDRIQNRGDVLELVDEHG